MYAKSVPVFLLISCSTTLNEFLFFLFLWSFFILLLVFCFVLFLLSSGENYFSESWWKHNFCKVRYSLSAVTIRQLCKASCNEALQFSAKRRYLKTSLKGKSISIMNFPFIPELPAVQFIRLKAVRKTMLSNQLISKFIYAG